MSDFFVGQKVVCVDDRPGGLPGPNPSLIKGEIYHISGIFPGQVDCTLGENNQILVSINERTVSPLPYYGQWRFRPLETKAIEIFRKIAQDVTDGKKVDINA